LLEGIVQFKAKASKHLQQHLLENHQFDAKATLHSQLWNTVQYHNIQIFYKIFYVLGHVMLAGPSMLVSPA
jgi:hypothetical protein